MVKTLKVKTTKILCGGMLAVLTLSACSSNSDDAVADGGNYLQHVTLQASMGGADTRALSEGEGNAINASFAEGDKVIVVDADGTTIVGTLTAATAGKTTTLSGEINTSTLEVNETVTLHYRSTTANYDNQTGTLAGIASGQDYAEGTLRVSTVTPLTFESNSVTLTAKQSITKFSFKDGTNDVSVKTFGIAATGLVQSIAVGGAETVGVVTGTLATASSDVYVALRNNSEAKQAYSFTIKDADGNWYTGKKNANLVNGNNYTATVALTKLDALTASSAAGTVGVVGGLPAIVVDYNGTTKAVALMNTGALCPEDDGNYYTFDNRTTGLSNDWYVPSQAELEALMNVATKAWATQNGVNGYTFTIEDNTLFLPAAGYYDNVYGDTDAVPTTGYYWSYTEGSLEGFAYSLRFSSTSINIYGEYKVNELNVRPFHTLK